MDHRKHPPSFLQYLPVKLLSPKSLLLLKQNCELLSCGFEHCIALINGQPWSWGFGGSGCLGHGAYETLTEPQIVNGIEEKVTYLEAGGYHNAVITKSRKVFVWGRGDVGQLGLSK